MKKDEVILAIALGLAGASIIGSIFLIIMMSR